VLDVVDGQEQLVIVAIGAAAIFDASVGQDAQHRQVVIFVEGQN
jgi:hypothetical protein